jgi:hypothetical protein
VLRKRTVLLRAACRRARRSAPGLHSARSVVSKGVSAVGAGAGIVAHPRCADHRLRVERRRAGLGLGALDARATSAGGLVADDAEVRRYCAERRPRRLGPAAAPRSPPGSGNVARLVANARDGRDAQQLCAWVLADRAGAAGWQAYMRRSCSSTERRRGCRSAACGQLLRLRRFRFVHARCSEGPQAVSQERPCLTCSSMWGAARAEYRLYSLLYG